MGRKGSLSTPQQPMPPVPVDDEAWSQHIDRVGKQRARGCLGACLILLGFFFLRPSLLAFVLLAIAIFCALAMPPTCQIVVMGGLPYGKIQPVALAQKPWWQTLLVPLDKHLRCLWTGVVARKSLRTSTDLVGRCRVILVGGTWFLQCSDQKHGVYVDVRAEADSALWRTYYTCPAVAGDKLMTPPLTSSGYKRRSATPRRADDEPLRIELAEAGRAWLRRRSSSR